ncbi:tetratricopeptide repeat protein [Ectobacillus funiculus]|uniref:tetratricopeptide repeat protein n=1 Tax=Ectobacillus funiculus TaxID=137993 RepID=UPI00397E8186
MGKNERVREVKGQVVTFHQSAEFFYERGMKAYRRNNLQEAVKYLKRAVDVKKEPFMLCQLAITLSEVGEYHESNQIFSAVLRADSTLKECHYFMANNYAYLGLFQQAKKYAQRYLETAEEEEFVEEALDLLDLIAEEEGGAEFEDEDELILMQEEANGYIRNGKLEEAIAVLQDIIAGYPEFWAAYNNLAIVRFQLGDVEGALQICEEVLEKNPGNLHALCNNVIFFYAIGRQKQVEELAKGLERVYPILTEHRFKLGTTFATIGHFELAYKWLKLLRRRGYEGDVSYYYWLAYSAYMVGDEQMAEKVWKQVIDLYPEREGKEPWRAADFTEDGPHQQALLMQLKYSFEEEETMQGKMLALYLMNELQTEEKADVFLRIAQLSSEFGILSRWARYFFLKTVGQTVDRDLEMFEQCAQVANALYSYTRKDDELIEECLQFWFYTFLHLNEKSTRLSNASAWSAAVEYLVRSDQKKNMTQAELGNIYNVSVSTVRKYVQALKQVFRETNQ